MTIVKIIISPTTTTTTIISLPTKQRLSKNTIVKAILLLLPVVDASYLPNNNNNNGKILPTKYLTHPNSHSRNTYPTGRLYTSSTPSSSSYNIMSSKRTTDPYYNDDINEEEESLSLWKQLVEHNVPFHNLLQQVVETNNSQDNNNNNNNRNVDDYHSFVSSNNNNKKQRKRGGGSRDILQPRHIYMFDDDTNDHNNNNDDDDNSKLFRDFARTICMASTVSKKELLETWSVALFIQYYFFPSSNNNNNSYPATPKIRRIADLACGHGLLSWALLVLLMNHNNDEIILSAICIDKRMPPKSVDKIQHVMLQRWPQLKHRWHYVEHGISAKENCIISHPSTLMCAIHGCGTLTDDIISLATSNNNNNNNNHHSNHHCAPLVLLPCCHTKKSLPTHLNSIYNSTTTTNNNNEKMKRYYNHTLLSTVIDQFRIQRLKETGYHVHTNMKIPQSITLQNSIIVAYPTTTQVEKINQRSRQMSMTRMPPPPPPLLNRKTNSNNNNNNNNNNDNKNFIIPLGPDKDSIAIIDQIAGRYAAQQRKMPPPPKFCISLFLPPSTTTTNNNNNNHDLTEEGLSTLANHHLICQNDYGKWNGGDTQVVVTAHVKALDPKPFAHPSGRLAQTFQITYIRSSKVVSFLPCKPISKSDAKNLFQIFCDSIPIEYPGSTLRLPQTPN